MRLAQAALERLRAGFRPEVFRAGDRVAVVFLALVFLAGAVVEERVAFPMRVRNPRCSLRSASRIVTRRQ